MKEGGVPTTPPQTAQTAQRADAENRLEKEIYLPRRLRW